jgi:hypothetical protein
MVTPTGIAEAQKIASEAAWLALLTIDTPEGILRFVNNNEPLVSNGVTYEAFPFSIVLPGDDGDTLPKVQLQIQNFDERLVEAIRAQETPPAITCQLVTSLTPDEIEIEIENLILRSVTYDALMITGDLTVVNVLNQKFGGYYTPVEFPGLFT